MVFIHAIVNVFHRIRWNIYEVVPFNTNEIYSLSQSFPVINLYTDVSTAAAWAQWNGDVGMSEHASKIGFFCPVRGPGSGFEQLEGGGVGPGRGIWSPCPLWTSSPTAMCHIECRRPSGVVRLSVYILSARGCAIGCHHSTYFGPGPSIWYLLN